MFKIIGVVVVYGFALLGFAKYLETLSSERGHAEVSTDSIKS